MQNKPRRKGSLRSDSLPWEARDLEAQLLAELLRLSRVSVLYGKAGAGKTTLLFTGVMPLLHRRADDCALASTGPAHVETRFPDRRRDIHSTRAELAIFFHAWTDKPLTALRAHICAALSIERAEAHPTRALGDELADWSKEFGVRFLIILDEFEHCLTAPPDREDIQEFVEAFSHAAVKSPLPANFLISVRDDAEPLLERLRARVPGIDNFSLRLPTLRRPTPIRGEPTVNPPLPVLATSETPPLVGTRYVETSPIEHLAPDPASPMTVAPTEGGQENLMPSPDENLCVVRLDRPSTPMLHALQGTAAHAAVPSTLSALTSYESYIARLSRPQYCTVTTRPGIERASPPAAAAPANALAREPVEAASSGSSSFVVAKTRPLKWLAIPLVCAPLMLISWESIMHRTDADRGVSTTSTAQEERAPRLSSGDSLTPVKAAPDLPRIGLAIDADNATDTQIAHDLQRLIAPDAGLALVVQPGLFLFSNDAPRLALMRYELLQTLRTIKGPAAETISSLRVVMPLYTEEIYFIARRDSPLTFIHQLEGARINVGIESSSRRLTVARLYEAMFGSAVPMTHVSFLADDAALKKLVDDKTVDVAVVVAAQPVRWLANLSTPISSSIKLLKLDPEHPASRRATDAFLPATIRAANYGPWLLEDTPTLATMAFLVSSGETNPAATESLEIFAGSLCRKLPLLRRDGHPKWREVQPGFEVYAGWPYSTWARTAFQSCRAETAAGASVVRR